MANRKSRRGLEKCMKEYEKYRRRVYRLSSKLKAIPYDEVRMTDALFVHEARILEKRGIATPPKGYTHS